MKKEQLYIRERIYKSDSAEYFINEKILQWKKLLGNELIEKIIENGDNIRNFFAGKEYRGEYVIEDYKIDLERYKRIKKYLLNFEISLEEMYSDFLIMAYERFEQKNNSNALYSENIMKQFLEYLIDDIELISLRVQISREHEEDLLIKEDLYQEYPVLERCLWDSVYKTKEFYTEFLMRMSGDKSVIESYILNGQTFQKIQKMSQNIADKHCGGRQVLQIEMDNGENIVYKPHDVKNELVFHKLINEIGQLCGIEMYNFKIVAYQEYGWEECIIQRKCESEEEVKKYYFRIGVILFVAYVLGTTDIHHENLIANGEYPVVIDLESISTGERVSSDTVSLSDKMLNESVLKSGILPYFVWKINGKGCDLSALLGGKSITPFKIPIVKREKLGKKYIVYEFGEIKNAKNRICFNGEMVSPKNYEQDIIEGFEGAYKLVLHNKKWFKEMAKELETLSSRYLVSHTQKYAMLLNSSYPPRVMKDAGDRELLLHILWKGRSFESEVDRRIVDAEIYDLLNGDIPYFYFFMNSTALYDSRGNQIKDFFKCPPIENIYKRTNDLSEVDLRRQKRFIHLSLAAADKESVVRENQEIEFRRMICTPGKYTIEEISQVIKIIMKHLIDECIYDPMKKNLMWYSVQICSEKSGAINISSCDMYLYNGIAGITLFVNMYSHYFKEEYKNIAQILIKQLQCYTEKNELCDENVTGIKSGLFHGEGSIVWTYLMLYKMDKKEQNLEYAKRHAEYLYRVSKTDRGNDLLDGKAGAVAAFCLLYKKTRRKKYIEYACEIADKIISQATIMEKGIAWKQENGDVQLLGMAHGSAGIFTVFAGLYQLTGDEKYYDVFRNALEYEDANYNLEEGDWEDFRYVCREKNVEQKKTMSWCHGAGGILLSRLILTKYTLKPEEQDKVKLDIKRAVVFVKNAESKADLCLCHGLCGNSLILDIYRKWSGEKIVCKNMNESENNKILTREWYDPGFMNGYTGIGYYLLTKIDKRIRMLWDF